MIYTRELTERKAVNRFGKLGYVKIREYVKTDNIDTYNMGKRIKYEECDSAPDWVKESDRVYKEDLDNARTYRR